MLDSGGMFLKHLEDAARTDFVALTAETFVKALGRMGYDGINLGRADLLLPSSLLTRLAGKAGFPILSANLRTPAGKAPFPASFVKEVGGYRVGVFGIVGNQALPVPGGGDLVHQDPMEAARQAVAELRKSCRLVIALSGLGFEEDARLARQVPGIDVILGGYTRALTTTPRIEGDTFIVQSGAKGMRLGKMEIEVAPNASGPWTDRAVARGGEGKLYTWSLLPLEASLPDDPAVAVMLDAYRDEMRTRNIKEQEPPSHPTPPPTAAAVYVGAAACGVCHPVQLQQWRASPHARAIASLAPKKQDANPECLRCHVTAFGEPGGFRPPSQGGPDLANVQCEACHGFGRDHRGPGKIRGRITERVCLSCHTKENSPAFLFELYLRRLGPHVARYFTRPRAPQPPPSQR